LKTLVSNYAFNASAKTITFNDFTSISLENILVITNVTDNIIIYNFADPTLGGTVLNNVLTLTYDTTSMSNTDKIQIFYDNPSIQPANAENQNDMSDLIDTLNYLASRLEFLSNAKRIPTSSGFTQGLRVYLDTDSSMSSVSLVGSVSSLLLLGNSGTGTTGVQWDGGFPVAAQMRTASYLGNINNVIVT
jgi:hypothetical protein